VTEIDPRDAKAWFNLGVLQGKLVNPHEKFAPTAKPSRQTTTSAKDGTTSA